MRPVTQSEVAAFRRCPRYHAIRYRLGYEAKEKSQALDFGSATHRWVEAMERGRIVQPDNPAYATFAMCEIENDSYLKDRPYEKAMSHALAREYAVRWAKHPYQPTHVEKQFAIRLADPRWRRRSIVDVVGMVDGQGFLHFPSEMPGRISALAIRETKTTSQDPSPGSMYHRKLRIDGQIQLYMYAIGAEVCIYDVIVKPRITPLKATPEENRKYRKDDGKLYAGMREADETPQEFQERCEAMIDADPDAFFVRHEVWLTKEELDEARVDFIQTYKLMRQLKKEPPLEAPRTPASCTMYGRECQYFGVCKKEADLDDPTKFVKLESVHSELAERVNS